MSIEALRWALDKGMEADLEPTLRYVLLILGNRADEHGYLYPSISWICQRTGLSRRTVQRHLQALQDKQLLQRDTRQKDDGARTSDALQLPIDQPGLFQTPPGATMAPPRVMVTPPPRHHDTTPRVTMTPNTQEGIPKNKTRASTFVLPPWVPVESWEGYEAMRKKAKKPMTDRAKKMIVGELEKLRAAGEDIGAVLDQSERKTWTDVYPVRKDPMRPASQGHASIHDTDNQLEQKAKDMGISTLGKTKPQLVAKINEKMGLH